MTSVTKILFIGPTRVGDSVLASSVLNYYYHIYPTAQFTIVTSRFSKELFARFPRLDDLFVIDKMPYKMHWPKVWWSVVGQRWDLVIDLRSSPVSYFLRANERKVFNGHDDAGHMVEQFSRFLSATLPLQPKIWYDQADRADANRVLSGSGPFLAVSPFSNWSPKDWPIEQYLVLLNGDYFKKYTIVLTGITKDVRDQSALDFFLDQVQLPVINLFDWGHLRHMVPIFERCDFFVGSDSGLMHLAASTQCKTLGLFGPTNAVRYRPWNNYVVQSDNRSREVECVDLSVDQVLGAIMKMCRSIDYVS